MRYSVRFSLHQRPLADGSFVVRVRVSWVSRRFEEVVPKWQVVSSHAARRSFVVSALRLGIPAEVIMSWTGHRDHRSMRPYIAIVDDLKAENMKKFNSLI